MITARACSTTGLLDLPSWLERSGGTAVATAAQPSAFDGAMENAGVMQTPATKRLLFLAGVLSLLIVAYAAYSAMWTPFFGPERTLESRVAGPGAALLLLVIGWAWIYRILRAR
jgi:hypothetical protein